MVAGLIIAGAVVYNGGLSEGRSSGGDVPAGEKIVTPAEAANAVGVNKGDFEKCMNEGRFADEVSADLNEGAGVGIGGTPTSVIVTESGDQYFVVGAVPVEILDTYVSAALDGDKQALSELDEQFGIPEAADVPALKEGDHVRGSTDAPVALIEYSDLECPFCRAFHPYAKQILQKYEGRVVWAYRHFPLETIHPSARPLAEGSECVAELAGEDKFWEYVDYVFEN